MEKDISKNLWEARVRLGRVTGRLGVKLTESMTVKELVAFISAKIASDAIDGIFYEAYEEEKEL